MPINRKFAKNISSDIRCVGTGFSIPRDLLSAMEPYAERYGRSAFVQDAIRHYLKHLEEGKRFDHAEH